MNAARIDLDAEERGAVHGRGERLSPAQAAEAGADDEAPREAAAEVLVRAGGERLVRALQDALAADVDPRAGGHLAVHGQAEHFETAELIPGRPARDEVRIGDQDARRFVVRSYDADGFAALDEERFVV